MRTVLQLYYQGCGNYLSCRRPFCVGHGHKPDLEEEAALLHVEGTTSLWAAQVA
jgi:hypothetical protein